MLSRQLRCAARAFSTTSTSSYLPLARDFSVIIASRNHAKVGSTENALHRCFPQLSFRIQPENAESGVRAQPVGSDETLRGAINRVEHASSLQPDASLAVSVEGGVEWLGEELHCFAWAAVRSGRTSAVSKARSGSFLLPREIAQLVRDGMELGGADDKIFGPMKLGQQRSASLTDSQGTIGFLTNNLISRQAYYEHAVMLALVPFMRPEFYPEYVME